MVRSADQRGGSLSLLDPRRRSETSMRSTASHRRWTPRPVNCQTLSAAAGRGQSSAFDRRGVPVDHHGSSSRPGLIDRAARPTGTIARSCSRPRLCGSSCRCERHVCPSISSHEHARERVPGSPAAASSAARRPRPSGLRPESRAWAPPSSPRRRPAPPSRLLFGEQQLGSVLRRERDGFGDEARGACGVEGGRGLRSGRHGDADGLEELLLTSRRAQAE